MKFKSLVFVAILSMSLEAAWSAPHFPLPPTATAPVIRLGDSNATREVYEAIDAILEKNGLPIDAAKRGYEIATVDCRNLFVVVSDPGYYCSLRYRIKGDGASHSLKDQAPNVLAKTLYSALVSAGAKPNEDPAHRDLISLRKMSASASGLRFEDVSNFTPYAPNVRVSGKLAKDLFRALDSVQNPKGTNLFVICDESSCGYQVIAGRVPRSSANLTNLAEVWTAFRNAATASGVRPGNGKIAEANVLNARDFTWDGKTLAFGLVLDSVSIPAYPGSR